MATATIEKPKRGSKSASIADTFKGQKGDISKAINASFKYFNVPTPKNDDEIAERINNYLQDCFENDDIPLVENLALAIGVTRTTLWEWETGGKGSTPVKANMIKKAKEILAGIDAYLVSKGKIPQVTYIFRAKNFFGMKDQQEVVLTPNNPLGDGSDSEQLKEKYLADTYGTETKVIEQHDTLSEIPQKLAEKENLSHSFD